jgi:sulfoxide reductase heme-binding subunit YedZ
MKRPDNVALSKPVVFVLALLPACSLLYDAIQNQLGPDPADTLALETGGWALRFLLLTLAVTPLRTLTGKGWVVRYRRMVGLFSLFYASLHFLVYLAFLIEWQWSAFVEDTVERTYMLVGLTAFLLLVPLGLTSTRGMMQRLGSRWKRLHRLVYVSATLAVIHFIWQIRSDFGEPMLYAFLLIVLLAFRLKKRSFLRRGRLV